jgi:hypothetical protein
MRSGPFDVTSQVTELSRQAEADSDPGVRADGRNLDHLGVIFDQGDLDEKTRNIAAKC